MKLFKWCQSTAVWWLVAWLLSFALTLPASAAALRVATLNQCLDTLLERTLVANHQVATEHYQSIEHRGQLEALLAWQPDVVVAGSFINPRLLARLRALAPHTKVVVVTQPRTLAQWWQQLEALDQHFASTVFSHYAQEQQQQLWRQQQQLQQLAEVPSTLVLMANFFTWGEQSWMGQLLNTLGAPHVAANWGSDLVRINPEQLLVAEPELVFLSGSLAQANGHYSRGEYWLQQPVLARWLAQRAVAPLVGPVVGPATTCPAARLTELSTYMTEALLDAATSN